MESITINQHPTTTTTTTTTSSALTVSEKENAALPPTCVVTRLAQMVLSTVAENVTIDVLLEPCAGDGRLGRAIAEQLLPSITSLTSIQFDKHPLHDDGQVECIDFCDGEQVGALNQRLMMLNDSRALVIINLPYNAPRMLETLTRNLISMVPLHAHWCFLASTWTLSDWTRCCRAFGTLLPLSASMTNNSIGWTRQELS